MIKLVLDSINLLSQANGELNYRRRAMIKPGLNENFSKSVQIMYLLQILSWEMKLLRHYKMHQQTESANRWLDPLAELVTCHSILTIIGIQKTDGGSSGPKATSLKEKGAPPDLRNIKTQQTGE